MEPRSPALQVDSLPSEAPGKPNNATVCCLSLLQWIFLTQESNQSLLTCRQILYQLSYQGSPNIRCSLFYASQGALAVRNPPISAGNLTPGSIPGSEDALEMGMATHSAILAWRILMDRRAWQATVHRVTQSQTQLKQLSSMHSDAVHGVTKDQT